MREHGIVDQKRADAFVRVGWTDSLPGEPEELYLCAARYLGHDKACDSLDRSYFPKLRVALSRQLGRRNDADDILQQDRAAEVCVGHLERALIEAINRLPLQDRRLLSLHYVQRLKIDDLATCLGVFRSTVYRRLRRVERRVERHCIRSIGATTGISDRDELIDLLRRGYREARVDSRVLQR